MIFVGILVGAFLGAVATYFIIRNNKELMREWIRKMP